MTEMEIDIRPAEPQDLTQLVELLHQLFAIEEDFSFDETKQRQGLAMMLDGGSTRRILVAEAQGQVIGMVSAQLNVSTAEGGWSALVEDMVLDAGWHGRGVGAQLLNAIEAWAMDEGATRIQLLADRENSPALGFYLRQGYSGTRLICMKKHLE